MLELAQVAGLTIAHWAIIAIIAAAVIAIMYVALNRMGIAVPEWVIQIFWILVVAVVAILAIKFLMGMA